ncbi:MULTISPECIES: YlaH-like family protein [Paenibacillus]|uniref:YlaH-like protein n=1 Tax=Paenibacillus agilis TaxID=3020863 RepID=A0A559J311_9BACL|nr:MULTISPECIES: YlaH-like family protein [Paenibacillus]MCR8845770.1 YlaH-like family protein [Paenibacillus sp. SC116]TVX94274.1 hypothetical protein FPZ44_15180 [Paenibacillus agilis]
MQQWFADHMLISYLLIFAFVAFIFNQVFRVQKLPLLKEIIIHIVMALGCLILLVLQIDKLPIIQCLFVAVVLMFMVRIRYFVEGRQKKKHQNMS